MIAGAGDSLLDGQGGQTRTGALPAWLRWIDNGAELTDYPNTSPVPQAGALAQLAEDAHDAGYETVIVVVRALSAQEIDVVAGQYVRQVLSDVRAISPVGSLSPHLFVISAMTNDCQSQAEVDTWSITMEQTCLAVGTVFPGVRCLIMEAPVVDPGPASGHQFADEIKAEAALIAAAHPDLIAIVSGVGLDLGVDGVHLLNTGYDEWGSRAWTAYDGMQ